ncbi:MAG: DUF29 domain-containing protein [Rhodospirillales bacterium]|nr:DUF29 domain-containing protein [Rhodospirillales bacterium]
MNKPLQDIDFLRWTIAQAAALRRTGAVRTNTPDPIDWEDVAEEIEALGRSERAALRSRIAVIVEHLSKLALSPAGPPREDWFDTLDTQRRELRHVLADSSSLKPEVPALVAAANGATRSQIARAAARRKKTLTADPASLEFSAEQVLDEDYPSAP